MKSKKIFWGIVLVYLFVITMLCFFPADGYSHCKDGHKGATHSQGKEKKN